MNYRHAFHAGNFADVFKHVFLTRILLYLARKDTAFRVIDTHAGDGEYDLKSEEALRGGEWRGGIGRLGDLDDVDARARELLKPYLDIVGQLDAEGRPAFYPGSPRIIQALMRPQDRATFCELHPQAFAALRAGFRRDERIACLNLDGYIGLNAGVPPKQRRGLVLIDPPYERANEFDLAWAAIKSAHAKWPTGIYALWYPVKDASAVARFTNDIAQSGIRRVLRLELAVGDVVPGGKLTRTGLILINPPYVLEEEAAILLPALASKLAAAPRPQVVREWLAGEWGALARLRQVGHIDGARSIRRRQRPMMMMLRSSPPSPFGRKVRIAIHHLGLTDRVDVVATDTASETDTIRRQNPLGKIPTLITEGGKAIYDSPVILEYLDHLAGGDRIIPADPDSRFNALTLQALADGILDASILRVYERRYRSEDKVVESWLAYQTGKVERALTSLEASPPGAHVDVGTITLACALGYQDLRFAGTWRGIYPRLVGWLDAFAAAVPAFEETRFVA